MRRASHTTISSPADLPAQTAEVIRSYGPFDGADQVHGVSYDGKLVWAALGSRLIAFDPRDGAVARRLARPADAGTAFDGTYIYQLVESHIEKLDPVTGALVATIPAPGQGRDSGLAWAEGSLWVGQYRPRQIIQVDPGTGRIIRTIKSQRFVTGVTWLDGTLWHATWEGEQSDLRRVDPKTGKLLERLVLPDGVEVSGLESDGMDIFYCGGGRSGLVRAVRRPHGAERNSTKA